MTVSGLTTGDAEGTGLTAGDAGGSGIVGSPVAAWTPADYEGRALVWYESNYGVTDAGGGAVSALAASPDTYYGPFDLAQSTPGLRMTVGETALCGVQTLKSIGDYLSAGGVSAFGGLHKGSYCWAFVVAKMGATKDPGVQYGIFGTTTSSAGVGAALVYDDRGGVSTEDGVRGGVYRGVGGTTAVNNVSDDAAMTPLEWHLVEHYWDPDEATASARSTIVVDEGTPITNNVSTDAVSASDASNPLDLFAGGGGNIPATGEFRALIIGFDPLTDTEKAQFRSYFRPNHRRINVTGGYCIAPIMLKMGSDLVIAYGAGGDEATGPDNSAHSFSPARNLVVREGTIDGGFSAEHTIASDDDNFCFGAGKDSAGRMLLWERRRTQFSPSKIEEHYLWRRDGADNWTQLYALTSPTYDMELIFGMTRRAASGRLISWWHNEGWDYGIIYSDDDGESWTQVRFDDTLSAAECPVEVQMIELPSGDLFAIGRAQGAPGSDPLWQIECDADADETDPSNWTVTETNIEDGTYTNAQIVRRGTDLDLYYTEREVGKILYRTAPIATVQGSPTSWPASTLIQSETTDGVAGQFGYITAVGINNGRNALAYYAGSASDDSDIFLIYHDL